MRPFPSGRTRIGVLDDQGVWTPHSGWVANKRMATGGYIEAMCVGLGNMAYKVAAAYLEYQNVESPSTTISPPTPEFNDTIAYYQGLYVAGADYLRLPLLVSPESESFPVTKRISLPARETC